MPLSDDELLASNPDAAGLIAAGVPREEVLQGLRNQTDAAAQPEPAPVVPPIARTASLQRGSAAPLPPGWEERFDPGTGRKFYLNSNTRETTWTRPRNQQAPPLYPSAEATPRSWDLNEMSARSPRAAVEPEPEPTTADAAGSPRKKSIMSNIGGLFGFGKKKPAEAEVSPDATAPAATTVAVPGEAEADVDTLLVVMSDATLAIPKRVDAAKSVSALVQKVAREGEATTEPAAASMKDGRLALRLMDVLGAVSEPPVQAALCHAIWLLAAEEQVKDAIAEGGGILYLGVTPQPACCHPALSAPPWLLVPRHLPLSRTFLARLTATRPCALS